MALIHERIPRAGRARKRHPGIPHCSFFLDFTTALRIGGWALTAVHLYDIGMPIGNTPVRIGLPSIFSVEGESSGPLASLAGLIIVTVSLRLVALQG